MSVRDNTYGIAELQNKMLELFKFFAKVCENDELTYWAAGGTCLGAIRHKGFIPWDDDLDVYMPRQDYEALWTKYKNKVLSGQYKFCRTTEEKNYHHRVIQLVDLKTTFIHSRNKNEDIEHGVYIDIIPIDACPRGRLRRAKQIWNAIIFSVFNIQCLPEYNGGKLTTMMKLGTRVLLGIVRNPQKRTKIWKRAEKKMSLYSWEKATEISCITSQFHELVSAFPKEWFCERKTRFEDIEIRVPEKAENYLRKMYGDYMKLPEASLRNPRHNTELIDLENGYEKYRGVFFATNIK